MGAPCRILICGYAMSAPIIKRIWDSVLHPGETDNLQSQAIRQTLSGGAATIVDLLVLQLGLALSIPVLLAALMSNSLASFVNFVIIRHYVYGQTERQKKSVWTQAVLYVPAVLVSMGLIQLSLLILSVWLGFHPMLVRIFVCIPVVFCWTLISGKFLIFDKRAAGEETSGPRSRPETGTEPPEAGREP